MEIHIPAYALDPLQGFLDYWENSRRLLDLSIEGLTILKDVPSILEGVRQQNEHIRTARKMLKDSTIVEPPPEELLLEMIKNAQAKADFSEKEIKSGFPLLHAQTLVGAWGALEAAIEDMLVGILVNELQHLQQEAFGRIRVPLAEFEGLDKEERMRFLIEEINRSDSLSRKNGVDAFEALLEKFLLSGALNAEVKKTLWEINHIRNVIVHRNSLADRRLVKSCQWLKLKVGDRVIVVHDQLERYGQALSGYVKTIIGRLENRYKVIHS
jgi:hypothetical protein